MNTRSLALACFGLLAVAGCKSNHTSETAYEVSEAASPVMFELTGMT